MSERTTRRSEWTVPGDCVRGAFLAVGGALFLALACGAPARADEPFACGLSEVRGVAQEDARSAAEIVCAELKRVSSGRGRYEISLAPLGRVVILTVARRDKAESITVRAEGLEEIPTLASRIAEALAKERPLADTQRLGNLTADETRPLRTKPGEAKFLTGVANVQAIGLRGSGASVSFGMMYAAERFSIPVETRLGWTGTDQGSHLNLFSASVGGRGYFTTRDVSPYLGAGLGLLTLDAGSYSEGGFYGKRIGFGTYVEAGVEALRLHRARVALAVRADLPTYSLHQDEYRDWDYATGQPGVVIAPARDKYVWPVSIGVSVAF